MKYFLILASLLSITVVFSQEFEIIEATSQKWAGGQERTGHGYYYNLTLKAKKSSQKLIFDKLWIGADFFTIKAYKRSGNKHVEVFNTNDTIYINARSQKRPIDPENPEENQKTIKELPPFDLKGAALLGYIYKGKRKYKTVEAFKEVKAVYYP